MLLGRSIGSGPACFVASQRNPCAMLLVSGFQSIRHVVEDKSAAWVTYLVKDQLKNIEMIQKVGCPTFFVHGQQDDLINAAHSEAMH